MGDRGCYAFMVSKQQKEHGMDISLFLESPSPRMWTALCPRSISKEALPFSPMTFLFAMDKAEPMAQKRDLQFLIFLKRCII